MRLSEAHDLTMREYGVPASVAGARRHTRDTRLSRGYHRSGRVLIWRIRSRALLSEVRGRAIFFMRHRSRRAWHRCCRRRFCVICYAHATDWYAVEQVWRRVIAHTDARFRADIPRLIWPWTLVPRDMHSHWWYADEWSRHTPGPPWGAPRAAIRRYVVDMLWMHRGRSDIGRHYDTRADAMISIPYLVDHTDDRGLISYRRYVDICREHGRLPLDWQPPGVAAMLRSRAILARHLGVARSMEMDG